LINETAIFDGWKKLSLTIISQHGGMALRKDKNNRHHPAAKKHNNKPSATALLKKTPGVYHEEGFSHESSEPIIERLRPPAGLDAFRVTSF